MEESRALADADRRPRKRMDRLVDATAALVHTLGAETLDPIAKATAAQARALVEARAVVLLLEERGNLVAAARTGEIPDGLMT